MKRAPMRITYWLVCFIVRTTLRVLYGLQIKGLENIPLEGKLILAANHMSDFDPPLVGSTVPREMYFAAKKQLFKGPFGVIMRHLNGIPINRSGSDKEAVKKLVEQLKNDNAILIFPEGTRSADPEGIEYKAGVGMLATMGNSDILPVRVDGTVNPKISLFNKNGFKITYGEIIKLSELMPEGTSRKEGYQAIASELKKRILAMKHN